MRLSMSLLFVVFATFLSISSCALIADVDQTAVILADLQSKEWTLTRIVSNGEDLDVSYEVLNFLSDTELEIKTERPNGTIKTDTGIYFIDFSTPTNIKFNIDIPNRFLIYPVLSLTSEKMIINSGVNSNIFSEYQ